ncbi:MAG: YraN family protein [Patescibacteria group bacterium]|jgi:putative endonuclease
MDKTRNKKTGSYGENLTAKYLESIGYKIIERNKTYPFGEIDILARDGKSIVIVEVKTVKGSGWGAASDLVRHKKQEKLKMLALVVSKEYPDTDIRIDVVGIDNGIISHIKNAVVG